MANPVGRPPKSLAQRVAEGNKGKRALPVGTPDPRLLDEEQAEWIRDTLLTSDEARIVWDLIYPGARAAKMLTEVDALSFVRYCEAEAWGWLMRKRRAQALEEVEAAQSGNAEDGAGAAVQRLQAFALQEKWATESANTGAQRMGFDGASRTRIKIDQQLDMFAEAGGTVVPIQRAVEIAREVMGGAAAG